MHIIWNIPSSIWAANRLLRGMHIQGQWNIGVPMDCNDSHQPTELLDETCFPKAPFRAFSTTLPTSFNGGKSGRIM